MSRPLLDFRNQVSRFIISLKIMLVARDVREKSFVNDKNDEKTFCEQIGEIVQARLAMSRP